MYLKWGILGVTLGDPGGDPGLLSTEAGQLWLSTDVGQLPTESWTGTSLVFICMESCCVVVGTSAVTNVLSPKLSLKKSLGVTLGVTLRDPGGDPGGPWG